jgi:hypothetical protein
VLSISPIPDSTRRLGSRPPRTLPAFGEKGEGYLKAFSDLILERNVVLSLKIWIRHLLEAGATF